MKQLTPRDPVALATLLACALFFALLWATEFQRISLILASSGADLFSGLKSEKGPFLFTQGVIFTKIASVFQIDYLVQRGHKLP